MKKYMICLSLALFIITSCGNDKVVEAESKQQKKNSVERILVHPAFNLTEKELNQLISDQNNIIVETINSNPELFLEKMKAALELPWETLVLVDKEHALPDNFEPDDIIKLTNYPLLSLSRDNHSLRKSVIPALLEMDKAAREEGITLLISSTYRSYKTQEIVFARHVRNMGEAAAVRVSARPGTSQHQLGVTIDFGSITDAFARTKAGKWLYTNAGKYGFSLSYPEGFEETTGYSWESWHYRYISKTGTELQKIFFQDIQQYFLEFFNSKKEIFRSRLILEGSN